MLSAVYSWHLPNAGDAFWAETFGRLFADIDLTVGSLQGIVGGRPTIVLSAACAASGLILPGSFFNIPPFWTPLSYAPAGALTGYYTTLNSGSYLRAALSIEDNASPPISQENTAITLGGVSGLGAIFAAGNGMFFRVVMNPGSLSLFPSLIAAPGQFRTFGSWVGVQQVTTPAVYALEVQTALIGSIQAINSWAFPAAFTPITLVCTEVRSVVL